MHSPTPKPETVDAVLSRIEKASTHPRQLARELIRQHRIPPRMTQAQIDGGYDDEERRRRLVGYALRYRRRGILTRLLWWR